MHVIRHPKLADDIRDAAMHYADISERIFSSFWIELDAVIDASSGIQEVIITTPVD